VFLILIFFFGASIAGLLCLLIRFFEPTPSAALVAGLSWTTFLKQAGTFAARQREDEQKTPK
jgi:hypothetical protein